MIPSKLQFSGPTVLIYFQPNRGEPYIPENAGIYMPIQTPEFSLVVILKACYTQYYYNLCKKNTSIQKLIFLDHKQVHFSHVMGWIAYALSVAGDPGFVLQPEAHSYAHQNTTSFSSKKISHIIYLSADYEFRLTKYNGLLFKGPLTNSLTKQLWHPNIRSAIEHPPSSLSDIMEKSISLQVNFERWKLFILPFSHRKTQFKINSKGIFPEI